MPSTRRPRASWKERTAVSVPAAEVAGLVARDVMTGADEALLEVPDRFPAVPLAEHRGHDEKVRDDGPSDDDPCGSGQTNSARSWRS